MRDNLGKTGNAPIVKVGHTNSGYLGSEQQGAHVLDVVWRVKRCNPRAIYVCDPVMGHPSKGCVVPPGVQLHHAESSVAFTAPTCSSLES